MREILEGDAPYDADLWRQVVEMGWTATVIPEEYDGLGLSYLELSVIAEELGRVLAPLPFSSALQSPSGHSSHWCQDTRGNLSAKTSNDREAPNT